MIKNLVGRIAGKAETPREGAPSNPTPRQASAPASPGKAHVGGEREGEKKSGGRNNRRRRGKGKAQALSETAREYGATMVVIDAALSPSQLRNLEDLAGIPCAVEVASEFRYRRRVQHPGTLLLTISQSGETADTLAALRNADDANIVGSLVIANVPPIAKT